MCIYVHTHISIGCLSGQTRNSNATTATMTMAMTMTTWRFMGPSKHL